MTAPSVLKQLNQDALDRIETSAAALAESYPELAEKAEAIKDTAGRDYRHRESNRLVALADFVENVEIAVLGERLEEEQEQPADEQSAAGEEESGEEESGEEESGEEPEQRPLEEVQGIGPEMAEKLREAGFETPQDLRDASDEDLLAVEGIGPATLEQIKSDL